LIEITPELRLLRAPSATYRALASGELHARLVVAVVARMLVPALVAGIATSVTATGRITWGLALSGAACWTLIPLLQLITSMAVVAPSRHSVRILRALEIFFTGHAAWSLWLIVAAALLFAAPGTIRQGIVLYTAVVPFVWTAFMTYAFCRQVLGLDPRRAAARTAIHQTLTAAAIVAYVAWAVALWPRIVAMQIP
jgi:hypothetical protein